jgi:hypothetical protein
MKVITIFLTLILFNKSLLSSPMNKFDHSHKEFTSLLEIIVYKNNEHNLVNYKKLKKDTTLKKLNNYLNDLSLVSQETFNEKFSHNQRLSFLINSYNAWTLKLITENYPLKSIKHLGIPFYGPWLKRFIHLFNSKISLKHLEDDLIRKNFKTPLIHFALNCASISCPEINKIAYNDKNIQEQLEKQTIKFINNKKLNKVDVKEKIIYISKIFEWYKNDFEQNGKDLRSFFLKYLKYKNKNIQLNNFKIKHIEYDWNLNETSK